MGAAESSPPVADGNERHDPSGGLLIDLVRTSRAVDATSARSEKIRHIARLLSRLPLGDVPVAVAYLAGELPQGRIGVGPATLREVGAVEPSSEPSLTLDDVDRALDRIAALEGPGSGAERVRSLGRLLRRATGEEGRFLRRLLVGELRQGAQGGVMLDAVARAADVPASRVRRAVMFAGDAGEVAKAALGEGAAALSRFSIRLFRPVAPMLAQSADGLEEALDRAGRTALEYKVDGARVQVHKRGGEVRIYTRRLNDETEALPDVVEAVRGLPARELVLDGEAVALGPDGAPRPFQDTMRRFGRVRDVDGLRRDLSLTTYLFDCLLLDGTGLVDEPGSVRWEALESLFRSREEGAPAGHAEPPAEGSGRGESGRSVDSEVVRPVARIVTGDSAEAAAFFNASRAAGHEGIMAKDPSAGYVAGRRGKAWLKVKPVHTADLVVLAAEWGHGRRSGWLSNLHLGAREPGEPAGPDGSGFAMVGKTFKGMTDATLEWQTAKLLELERAREGHVVHVRPELVVEVAFDGVQRSPRYPGGVALRFARVKGYREDRDPSSADTIEALRSLLPG